MAKLCSKIRVTTRQIASAQKRKLRDKNRGVDRAQCSCAKEFAARNRTYSGLVRAFPGKLLIPRRKIEGRLLLVDINYSAGVTSRRRRCRRRDEARRTPLARLPREPPYNARESKEYEGFRGENLASIICRWPMEIATHCCSPSLLSSRVYPCAESFALA